MKLLSLIIPTYNMAALLPRCLESLVRAKHVDALDILVVNDGSKDNSLQVAREWEKKYPTSIRVIDKPNGNYGSTINAALPVAEGLYVKVLDSDDWFEPDCFEKALRHAKKTDADIVVFRRSYTLESKKLKPVTEVVLWDQLREEIVRILQEFPFTYRERLNDPKWISQTQDVLRKEIAELEKEKIRLEKIVSIMEKGDRR